MKCIAMMAAWVLVAVPAMAVEQEVFFSDYGQALQQTRESKQKPLLVILEHPKAKQQIEQVSHSDSLGASAGLLNDYTVCRIDAGTEYGQAVAKAFKTTTFPHTVVIDRSGKWQVFKKTGEFSSPEWNSMLVKYSQPEPAAQPVRYQYNYNYCPSCRRR